MFIINHIFFLGVVKLCLWIVLSCVPQGMLTLVSNCIDRLNVYNSAAHFGECAGSEAGAAWKDILNLLYELLGNKLLKQLPHIHKHAHTCVQTHLD